MFQKLIFNHKNFFRPIWNVTICENILHFDALTWSSTSNLGSSLLFFFIKVNICVCLCINRLHFDCAMICFVVFVHPIYQYTHFLILKSCIYKFYFFNKRFSFVMSEIYFYIIVLQPWCCGSIVKFTFLSTHILFGLELDSSESLWKTLIIVVYFLSLKRIAHAYF